MIDQYAYDEVDWLVSASRCLVTYVSRAAGDLVDVEDSYPDTSVWTKDSPLGKTLIHIDQDDKQDPVLGFGSPGVGIYDYDAGTVVWNEAAMHLVSYDVGVWCSSEAGGSTARMRAIQLLTNLFSPASARRAFNQTTGGLQVVSFNGGRNELDRINDLPVWRGMEMTLILRAFSRHPQPEDQLLTEGEEFTLDEELTIVGEDGASHPLTD